MQEREGEGLGHAGPVLLLNFQLSGKISSVCLPPLFPAFEADNEAESSEEASH